MSLVIAIAALAIVGITGCEKCAAEKAIVESCRTQACIDTNQHEFFKCSAPIISKADLLKAGFKPEGKCMECHK